MNNSQTTSFHKLSSSDLCHEAQALEMGMNVDEYERLVRGLKREPTKLELAIVLALWSEHCSYKSSRIHLSKLSHEGPRVLVGPGENAGVIDIGDDLALVFKIESHNHPSFIEPFQGAATGVGGILRDIFTMGARPFAAANYLRFGEPHHPKVPALFEGVIGGIANYGNCFGVPTVMTNVDFHHSYNGNNLVNAFALGVLKQSEIMYGKAQGLNNRLLYVGAHTGRDGIMGAVMASDVFGDDSDTKKMRPCVQVGDPFTEKILLEACFQAFSAKLVVGIQDMGAAGLSCASFEMAARASTGLVIDLDQVPVRDAGLSAYEIMLSESQERMLLVAEPDNVEAIKKIFQKYELSCADIGYVSDDGQVRISHHQQELVNLNAKYIVEISPRYEREYRNVLSEQFYTPNNFVDISVSEIFARHQRDFGQRDLRFITEQFDHHIGLNTIVGPDNGDLALMAVPGSNKAVAIAISGEPSLLKLNPYEGARRSVFLGALKLSTHGALAVGITNCLNFGSPEKVAVMSELVHVIDGMAEAAKSMAIPVVSGNVSLYNETDDKPILPTLALCTVGLSENSQHSKYSRINKGDVLAILGPRPKTVAGYEAVLHRDLKPQALHGWEAQTIMTMVDLMQHLIHTNLVHHAQAVERGGLFNSLIKLLSHRDDLGIRLNFGDEWRDSEVNLALVSEDSPLILLVFRSSNIAQVKSICENKIELNILGQIDGDHLSIYHRQSLLFSVETHKAIHSFSHGLRDFFAASCE